MATTLDDTAAEDPIARLRRLATPDAGPAPVLSTQPVMGAAPFPRLGTPDLPQNISVVPTAPEIARDNTTRDLTELKRLGDTGSGISQIKNGFGRGLARIGEGIETALLPQFARFTPGTEANHQRLLNQEQGRLNNDLGVQQKQAQERQTEALTNYTLQRPDIEQSKIDQRQLAVQQKVGQLAAAHGQKVNWDNNGNPSFEDDLNSEAYQDRVHLAALHDANAEKAKIQADIAKNHYLPGTPEYAENQRKLDQVDQRLRATMGSLGLRAQGLGLRREQMNANLYGVGPDGQPLPGAVQIDNGEGGTTTVGLRAGANAAKQQKAAATFNDLVGSTQHTADALENLHRGGGSLADAKVMAAMSDPHSLVGRYVNGQLVRGNLNDREIQALGALNQLREQIGILRSTTGGTAAEAQAQRMLETLPAPGDSPAIVRNKLKELQGVIQRVSPAISGVSGGIKPGGRSGSTTHDIVISPEDLR